MFINEVLYLSVPISILDRSGGNRSCFRLASSRLIYVRQKSDRRATKSRTLRKSRVVFYRCFIDEVKIGLWSVNSKEKVRVFLFFLMSGTGPVTEINMSLHL